MALTRPILYNIPAFDSSDEKVFTFNVAGGDQVVSNKLTITDNDTSSVVYESTQITLTLTHTLPQYSLLNGKYYSATITTYNIDSEASSPSLPILFRCYTTPYVSVNNLTYGDTIQASGYRFDFSYYQVEGELLNAYVVNLYSNNMDLIETSGKLNMSTTYNWISTRTYTFNSYVYYAGEWYQSVAVNNMNKRPDLNLGTYWSEVSLMPSLFFDYTFNGFEDNVNYYIEIEFETINRTIATTGKVQFFVDYIRPANPSIVDLENDCSGGKIKITSNLSSIQGTATPLPPTYLSSEEIDLRAEGSNVVWDSDFIFTDNYTAKIYGRDMTEYSKIIEMRNLEDSPSNPNKVEAYYMQGYETPYTNVIPNGDFSTGLSPWSTRMACLLSIEDGKLKVVIKNTSPATSYMLKNVTSKYTLPTHKYYISFYSNMKALEEVSFGFGEDFVVTTGKGSDDMYLYSGIITSTVATNNFSLYHQFTSYQVEDSILFDNFICIDLTETFGAGNEPDEENCDMIFRTYIDSTNTKTYVLLKVYSGDEDNYYVINSNYITNPSSEETVAIWIRCKDGLYSCQIGSGA